MSALSLPRSGTSSPAARSAARISVTVAMSGNLHELEGALVDPARREQLIKPRPHLVLRRRHLRDAPQVQSQDPGDLGADVEPRQLLLHRVSLHLKFTGFGGPHAGGAHLVGLGAADLAVRGPHVLRPARRRGADRKLADVGGAQRHLDALVAAVAVEGADEAAAVGEAVPVVASGADEAVAADGPLGAVPDVFAHVALGVHAAHELDGGLDAVGVAPLGEQHGHVRLPHMTRWRRGCGCTGGASSSFASRWARVSRSAFSPSLAALSAASLSLRSSSIRTCSSTEEGRSRRCSVCPAALPWAPARSWSSLAMIWDCPVSRCSTRPVRSFSGGSVWVSLVTTRPRNRSRRRPTGMRCTSRGTSSRSHRGSTRPLRMAGSGH